MKKSKIKKIPMYSTSYYDHKTGTRIENSILSHIAYDGDYKYQYDDDGKAKYVKDSYGRLVRAVVEPTMVDNLPFDDEFTYYSYYRGRSAAGALFFNDKGQRFTVFMTDLDKFIPLMVNGKIKGKFIHCKRGKNYGVTLYDDTDTATKA